MDKSQAKTPPSSLTYHRRVAALHRAKADAIKAVPEYDVKEVGVRKVNKAGDLILENGMPVIVEQRVLVRDLVQSEWDDKIKAYEDSYPAHKGECPACLVQ